jgi:hypothetical protein
MILARKSYNANASHTVIGKYKERKKLNPKTPNMEIVITLSIKVNSLIFPNLILDNCKISILNFLHIK